MKFKDMPYERVNYEQTEAVFKSLTERVKNAGSAEELWQIHQDFYKAYTGVADMLTIAHIRYDGDTTDEFYSAEQEYYDEVRPKLANLQNGYRRAFDESPHRKEMEEKSGKVAFETM